MYERFLNQLKQYAQAIRVLSKGQKQAIQIKNRDYDLVIKK